MGKQEVPQQAGLYGGGRVALAGWGAAHDLVNMYLAIAQMADSELTQEEQRIFMRKFGQWMPDITLEQFEKIWSEVLSVNGQIETEEARYAFYLQSALNIAQFMGGSKDKLKSIVRDLVDIAGADGRLHDNEITMIKAVAIAYGLSADLRVNANTGRVELTLKDAN
jgi:tellurite resistance protein